ncbi:MAG: hypothetical protein RBR50_01090 [Candidatus Izemoplasmatales bacterium]|nr:hypothetical protein [Candidatus Izemoplasmatales bacterium]
MQFIVKNGEKFIYGATAEYVADAYRNDIEHFLLDDKWVSIIEVSKTDSETIINIEVTR